MFSDFQLGVDLNPYVFLVTCLEAYSGFVGDIELIMRRAIHLFEHGQPVTDTADFRSSSLL